MSRRAATCLALAGLALGAAGCTSTQDKAAALQAQGAGAIDTKTVAVGKTNPDIEVVRDHVVQDENGTAVVLELRNTSKTRYAEVPVIIDVQGEGGASLYRNDIEGLERSVQQYAVLRPERDAIWVNDVVTAAEKPAGVTAEIGAGTVLDTEEPRLTIQNRELRDDVDGATLTGFIANKSDVPQKDVVVYAAAYDGNKVVAAGRAMVPTVKAKARTRFNVLFIGDPTGARIELDVPPTVLTPGKDT